MHEFFAHVSMPARAHRQGSYFLQLVCLQQIFVIACQMITFECFPAAAGCLWMTRFEDPQNSYISSMRNYGYLCPMPLIYLREVVLWTI